MAMSIAAEPMQPHEIAVTRALSALMMSAPITPSNPARTSSIEERPSLISRMVSARFLYGASG